MKQEKEELFRLSEYFNKIDEDQCIIDAENFILEQEHKKEQAALSRIAQSATIIQSLFRGFRIRKWIQSKKKKKKKKGGKKKKRS